MHIRNIARNVANQIRKLVLPETALNKWLKFVQRQNSRCYQFLPVWLKHLYYKESRGCFQYFSKNQSTIAYCCTGVDKGTTFRAYFQPQSL